MDTNVGHVQKNWNQVGKHDFTVSLKLLYAYFAFWFANTNYVKW